MKMLRLTPLLSLAALLLVSPKVALSQEQTSATVHWAYSAYFGTGWYSVPGDRDVFVVRMSYRHAWDDASLDVDGRRTIGKHLKFPASVALNQSDFERPLEAADPDNLSFLSINPDILPLTEDEIAVLPDLILARHLTTVMITHWRASLYPENAEYILRNEGGARQMLYRVTGLSINDTVGRFLDVCKPEARQEAGT